jgi:CheY-like chemotaxis protein
VEILLVEDDPDVREATEALLQAEGARVVSFADADPALTYLCGPAPIDVLLSDIVLSGQLSGLDVLEVARRVRPTLPAVVTTGYAASQNGIARQIPRDVPLLLKPFRRLDLMSAILACLPLAHCEAA